MSNQMISNDEKGPRATLIKKVSGRVSRNSLDSIERNSNSSQDSVDAERNIPAPCKSADFLLSGTVDSEGLFSHFKTFCKSYRCDYCGPRKVFQVQKGIELAIDKFGLRVFASLTLDPKTAPSDPNESRKYIRKSWNKFRILQMRKFNTPIQFVSVVEFQKNGRAHLHILFDQFINHEWLKQAWVSVGGGPIVDIRKADTGAARYLSKYLGKQMRSLEHGKGRAYSTSQGINLNELLRESRPESNAQYRFCKVSETEARNILGNYIHSDLTDRRNYIQGFRATRRIKPPEPGPTLCNVNRSTGSTYERA